jgi:hypothetical protein
MNVFQILRSWHLEWLYYIYVSGVTENNLKGTDLLHYYTYYHSGVCLEGLMTIMKKLSQCRCILCRDLKPEVPSKKQQSRLSLCYITH